MKRAVRRHHRERLKQKRKYYHAGLRPPPAEIVAFWVDTPCPCSCSGCGNQRRAFNRDEPTMQERRWFEASGIAMTATAGNRGESLS